MAYGVTRGTSAVLTDRRVTRSVREHATAVPNATVPALATAHERLYSGWQGLCGSTFTKRYDRSAHGHEWPRRRQCSQPYTTAVPGP